MNVLDYLDKYIDFKFSALKFGEVNEFDVVLSRFQKIQVVPIFHHLKTNLLKYQDIKLSLIKLIKRYHLDVRKILQRKI